jgi:hypothetical protein
MIHYPTILFASRNVLMPVLWLILALFITTAAVFSTDQRSQNTGMVNAEISATAGNILVYRNAVSIFSESNVAYSGVIPDAALALPTWYTKTLGLGNYAVGGTSYVYYTNALPGLVSALGKKTESTLVGTNTSGVLVTPNTGNTGIALPAQIPAGAVVILK